MNKQKRIEKELENTTNWASNAKNEINSKYCCGNKMFSFCSRFDYDDDDDDDESWKCPVLIHVSSTPKVAKEFVKRWAISWKSSIFDYYGNEIKGSEQCEDAVAIDFRGIQLFDCLVVSFSFLVCCYCYKLLLISLLLLIQCKTNVMHFAISVKL